MWLSCYVLTMVLEPMWLSCVFPEPMWLSCVFHTGLKAQWLYQDYHIPSTLDISFFQSWF